MCGDIRYGVGTKVRHALDTSISVGQRLIDFPFHLGRLVLDAARSHDALLKENVRLSYQQALLQGQLQRLLSLQAENKDLRRLLAYADPDKHLDFLLAELLNVRSHPYRRFIVVNRGAKHGVKRGLAVFDAFGVLGQVIDVGKYTATVMLITDPRSAVPVKNARTGERSLAIGNADNGTSLSLAYVSKTATIKPGDLWLTSGLGGRFPEGYPVGVVYRIQENPGQAFVTVNLRPAAQFEKSRLLLMTRQR